MNADEAAPAAGRKPEARLALVLNGGVSLAVWMSGVTREIDALQHAQDDIPADASTAQREYAEVWRDILAASGRPRVVVDLIAGTSAGGLNGALLGSAIARGERIGSDLRELWIEAGSLKAGKLIQPIDSIEKSLLSGSFFTAQIHKAFGLDMDEDGTVTMIGSTAGTQNCTLLMTATALRTRSDSAVGPDSRRVYRFRHRVDQGLGSTPPAGWLVDDFCDHAQALALATRASASFPAAFNPVFESADLGSLRTGQSPQAPSYLVDGGVLDNSPFGPLFEELRTRPVKGRFDRILLYVKPSADDSAMSTPLPPNPPIAKVLGRVLSASQEPDDRQDAQQLAEMQVEMRYTGTAPHLLLAFCWQPGSSLSADSLMESAHTLLEHYLRSRQQAFAAAGEDFSLTQFDPPPVQLLPQPSPPFSQMDLDMPRGSWTWGVSVADRVLRWWGRILNSTQVQFAPEAFAEAFRTVYAGQRLTTVFLEGDGDEGQDVEFGRELADAMWRACDDVAAALPEIAASGAGRNGLTPGELFMQASLSVEVLTMPFSWGREDPSDSLRFAYHQITPAVPPLVDVRGAGESPYWERAHLYGSRWGRFGAFGAPEWRASDWLWGRLDGARQLLELLVPDGPEREALLIRLGAAILAEEGQTLAQVRASAESVRMATATTLWNEFITDLDPPTREAILSKLERIPGDELPPATARLVLAAFGRTRPKSPAPTWLGRRAENIKLLLVRIACVGPRFYLHRKIGRKLIAE